MNLFLKLFFVLLSLTIGLGAKEIVVTGSVSVFLFLDGKPLVKNEVVIDGKKRLYTDSDGWASMKLPVGKHQVEVVAKTSDGANIGYLKKPFVIKRDRDTQIIATFRSDTEASIEIDEPIGEMKDRYQTKTKATGKGYISGRVIIRGSQKPIADARVFVRGTDIDARTDANGNFRVEVPAGIALGLSVVHSAYSAQTLNDIKIEPGATVTKTVALTPASMELEEFVVLAPKVQGSIASVMAEEKETNAIANILGSEQISKKGDSSAAGALKRVTGITLVGSGNIYVRGLGERYSNIEMNSMPLPSPDPTRRVVPLDIFPASVIGSLKVQKSASADIPNDFGGGYIDIRTKDKSDQNFTKISIGFSAHENTGKKTLTYKGSSTDWLGIDDGYRDLPKDFLDATDVHVGERIKSVNTRFFTKEQIEKFTKNYANRSFDTYKEALPPGFKFAVEGARKFEIGSDSTLSVFGNYSYSQKHSYHEEENFRYNYKADGQIDASTQTKGVKTITKSTYSHGAILNIGYSYKDFLKLKYTKLYTLKSEKRTRMIQGILGSNDEDLSIYNLDWEERSLDANQFSGSYEYYLHNHFNELFAGLEYATASFNQPGNINYSYINEDGNIHIDGQQEQFLIKRIESDDDLLALYLKNRLYLDWWSEEDYLEVGISHSGKDRVSKQRTFYLRPNLSLDLDDTELTDKPDAILDTYVRIDAPYDERYFYASSLFNPADYFDASLKKSALYIQSLLEPHQKVEILGGLKLVSVDQTIYQYIPNRNNGHKIEKVPENLDLIDFFPNISLKYKASDTHHFDVALSRTYIIPDFREFSSGSYFHPFEVATVRGNPELKVTDIYNIDLKYSYYMGADENIKTALFFKYLDKPIEDTSIPSSSLPEYSYANADFAILYGVEIEGRKRLDIIKEGLEDFYISGNFSYIDSEVTLQKSQEEIFTTNHRQLQGLSPTILNLTFGYDTKKRSLTLSYNKMGERIRKVGLKSSTEIEPDNIEKPAPQLDFVWIENITKKIKCSLKAKNLLDKEVVWEKGGLVTKRFKKGRSISMSIGYKF